MIDYNNSNLYLNKQEMNDNLVSCLKLITNKIIV